MSSMRAKDGGGDEGPSSSTGTWQWMDNGGVFKDYAAEHNSALEAARARGATEVNLGGTHGWLIDLFQMTQRNTSAAYRATAPVRKVRRIAATSVRLKRDTPDSDGRNDIRQTTPVSMLRPSAALTSPVVAVKRSKCQSPNVFELFKKVDTDECGYIDRDQVASLTKKLGRKLDQKQLDKAMDLMDPDGDGEVTFTEFEHWWETHAKKSSAQRVVTSARNADTGRILGSALSTEQAAAAKRAEKGESLFITGAAGTGKSFLLRFIIQQLRARCGEDGASSIIITAPTGIAAVNVGGVTVHSFAGIGQGRGSQVEILSKVQKNRKACANWQQAKCLIVDEVSMLSSELFDLLDYIGRNIRVGCLDLPFGGVQLILCGDFFQLPPVNGRFAFEGKAWAAAGLAKGTVVLQQPHRQRSHSPFVRMLNNLRTGVLTDETMQMLQRCMATSKPKPTDGILPTKLYCMNRDVDAENERCLRQLAGDAAVFLSIDRFKGVSSPAHQQDIAKKMENKVCSRLTLKVGAQVILLRNDPANKLANGSRGVVVALDPVSATDETQKVLPTVRFDTGQEVKLSEATFFAGSATQNITRVQLPLKLGWALTVHRSQGMTLSRAEVDVSGAFAYGQAYVALSRVTDIAGLWMCQNLLPQYVRASPDVKQFYGLRVPTAGIASAGSMRNYGPADNGGGNGSSIGSVVTAAAAHPQLTPEQLARIRANRKKAMELKRARQQATAT